MKKPVKKATAPAKKAVAAKPKMGSTAKQRTGKVKTRFGC